MKIIFEVLSIMVKVLPLPSIKKALSRHYIENNINIGSMEIESAYIAGTGQVGTTDNPFHYVILKEEVDVRCNSTLEIERIFLRKYLNGCPSGYIIWDSSQGHQFPLPQEVYTSPMANLTFPKNSVSIIRFGIPIPPFVSLDKDIYISVAGCMILKSSLGSFIKQISSGKVHIDKTKWIRK